MRTVVYPQRLDYIVHRCRAGGFVEGGVGRKGHLISFPVRVHTHEHEGWAVDEKPKNAPLLPRGRSGQEVLDTGSNYKARIESNWDLWNRGCRTRRIIFVDRTDEDEVARHGLVVANCGGLPGGVMRRVLGD